MQAESSVLGKQYKVLVLSACVCFFGGSMVFRNLAFYRYRLVTWPSCTSVIWMMLNIADTFCKQNRSGARLTQDIGFDILPEFVSEYTNSPLTLLTMVLVVICIRSFVFENAKEVYVINVVTRLLSVVAIGTILRFFTYISTTLPGSANHCLESNPNIEHDRPKTIHEILFTLKGHSESTGSIGTYNCGDLTFSGHQLTTVTTALCCLRYARLSNPTNNPISLIFSGFVWLLVFIQACTIVMARYHYTMDITISCYLTPLIWNWYITSLQPLEVTPYWVCNRCRSFQQTWYRSNVQFYFLV